MKFLYWLRSRWLDIVTLGAWSHLGSFSLDLSEGLDEEKSAREILEHRVNELMRQLIVETGLVINATIAPPQLTVYGEGVSIEEESERVKAAIELERSEAPARGAEVANARRGRIAVLMDQIDRAVETSQEDVGIDLSMARQELNSLQQAEAGLPSESLDRLRAYHAERLKELQGLCAEPLPDGSTAKERLDRHMLEKEIRRIKLQLS